MRDRANIQTTLINLRISYIRLLAASHRVAAHLPSCLLAVVLLASCRKDLCYDYDAHSAGVKVNVVAEWELEWERPYDLKWPESWPVHWPYKYDDFRPKAAEGIRAIVYPEAGSHSEGNLPREGGRFYMPEGTHDLMFYNNDTEYIVFSDITHLASASATTRTVTRSSLPVLHSGERTVNQPDQLYGSFRKGYTARLTLETVNLPVQMRPLTYTYYIRYRFEAGLQYVALARGALAGMAESVYLMDGHTGDNAATVLFDASLTDWGIEARMNAFGVPNHSADYYTRADGSSARYTLNLEVRLKNGKMLNYNFDVTDQLNAQPRGGVIQVTGVEVSDEDGKEGSGGFDVSVDGWGEWVDIPLPLK